MPNFFPIRLKTTEPSAIFEEVAQPRRTRIKTVVIGDQLLIQK